MSHSFDYIPETIQTEPQVLAIGTNYSAITELSTGVGTNYSIPTQPEYRVRTFSYNLKSGEQINVILTLLSNADIRFWDWTSEISCNDIESLPGSINFSNGYENDKSRLGKWFRNDTEYNKDLIITVSSFQWHPARFKLNVEQVVPGVDIPPVP